MPAPKKNGLQTVWFQNPPVIISTATIVGSKEGQGPLGHTFDKVVEDNYYGEDTWEKAERRMLKEVMQNAIQRANLQPQNIDCLLAGDLLNQIISANFVARDLGIPFLGLYGACSTMYEGLALGAMLIDGGFADYVLVGVSSHNSTAERQYRYPTEQGVQRPLYASWTVTGAAAAVLARQGNGPVITHATIGKVVDLGQSDPMNMGAAMAPAAADTMARHLMDTQRQPAYYDLFITGDLGTYGRELALKLMQQKGYDISDRFSDCGILIYSPEQDAHAGGSGCACAGVVTCGYLIQEIKAGRLKRILGVATGALLSLCSYQQGETIPGIAHAVVIEGR
ncbi:stage V sporulation protein AD [Desulfofundulus australicus DSM 11792]|uniref:Stage V sporulation protein AD n=1 Tax=Desulfofundulus australicus DSM 11792 TaxID=1121425 RepID=A0A1M5CJX3_9FIRM|nr:stage V sporulation protein AD [Desulfofundulus australicus]SHF55020.1 stage V sporulation protein AD [Desulfofundulus australicus DSM 11792]